MSNVLYLLPSLDLGFKARLEAIETIVKGEIVVLSDGAIWSIGNLWVAGDTIVSASGRGAYRLAEHVAWLKGHVSRAADIKTARDMAAEERAAAWRASHADRPTFQPRKPNAPPRSIHPNGRAQKATKKVVEAEVAKIAVAKPIQLNAGKASDMGRSLLAEKGRLFRKEIEARIMAAIEAEDVEMFDFLTAEIERRVASVTLSSTEVLDLNRKAEIEYRETRLRDPNFGAAKKKVAAPKADKKAKGEKKGRGNKRAA